MVVGAKSDKQTEVWIELTARTELETGIEDCVYYTCSWNSQYYHRRIQGRDDLAPASFLFDFS